MTRLEELKAAADAAYTAARAAYATARADDTQVIYNQAHYMLQHMMQDMLWGFRAINNRG